MKFIFLNILALFSLQVFGSQIVPLTITNNIDKNVITISIKDHEGEFNSITKLEESIDGSVIDNSHFNLQQLFIGSTVQVQSNRDVVKIKFDRNFDSRYGGRFVMDYLYSGISGQRRELELDLRKNGDTWEVTLQNKVIHKLHVIGHRKAIIGLIGIARIEAF